MKGSERMTILSTKELIDIANGCGISQHVRNQLIDRAGESLNLRKLIRESKLGYIANNGQLRVIIDKWTYIVIDIVSRPFPYVITYVNYNTKGIDVFEKFQMELKNSKEVKTI